MKKNFTYLYEGRPFKREVDGSEELTQTFIGVDFDSAIAFGLVTSGALGKVIYLKPAKPEHILCFWRGVKILELVSCVSNSTLEECWSVATDQFGTFDYKRNLGRLIVLMGKIDKNEILLKVNEIHKSRPNQEELENMVNVLCKKCNDVDFTKYGIAIGFTPFREGLFKKFLRKLL